MNTAGYDLAVEVQERFVNKLLTAAYYSGKFPKSISGSYKFPIPNIPEDLKDYTKIDYKLDFGLPILDFVQSNALHISWSAAATFIVLGGIELKIDTFIKFLGSAKFNQATKQLKLDLSNPNVNIEFDDTPLPNKVTNKLNQILATAMEKLLTEEISTIELTQPLYSGKLPECDKEITVNLGNIKTTDDIAALAVNFLDYNGGNITNLTDFRAGSDLGIGVSENAMHRVFDFWWANTKYPKSISKTVNKTFETDTYDNYFDWLMAGIAAVVPGLGSIIAAIASSMIDINEVKANMGADISINKPSFELLDNQKIKIVGSVNVATWAELFLKITINYLFGSDTYNKKIASYSNKFNVSFTALGSVGLNSQNCLVANIEDIDLEFEGLFNGAPEFLLNFALNWLIDTILDIISPIILSPILIAKEIPGTQLSLAATVNKIEINTNEVIVCAKTKLTGLENLYKPLFIANKNPKSMEVHRAECEWANKIADYHRVSYFFLDEAYDDGYDDCAYCLPNSKR